MSGGFFGMFMITAVITAVLLFEDRRATAKIRDGKGQISGPGKDWHPSVLTIIKGDTWANCLFTCSFFPYIGLGFLIYFSGKPWGDEDTFLARGFALMIGCLFVSVICIWIRVRMVRGLFTNGVELSCRYLKDVRGYANGPIMAMYEYALNGKTYKLKSERICSNSFVVLVDPNHPRRAVMRDNFIRK